jgi:hypothetical protein
LAAIFFLIVLAFPVLLAIHATDSPAHIAETISRYEQIWESTLISPPVLALLELFAAQLFPAAFMLWGMWFAAFVSLASAFFYVFWRAYVGIALFVVFQVFTIFFFVWMPPGQAFATEMLRFARRFVFSPAVLIAFLFFFVVVAAVVVLHGYLVCHAVMQTWPAWPYVALAYTFWVLSLVVGQIMYQFVAQVVAARVFAGPRGSEPRQWSYAVMLGRSMFTNIGVATFNAAVLPWIHFLYAIAQVDASEVAERLKFCRCLSRCIGAIYAALHRCAVPICRCLDRGLAWPCERAAIYSAIFGIPRNAASRRVAETEAKFFTSVMNVNCYVDYLVAFIGLTFTVTCACASWGYSRDVKDAPSEWIGCAFGGCAAFAFCNLVRMLLLGITDAVAICFFENPEAMLVVSRDTEAQIRYEYEMGVRRKREVAVFRNRGEYAAITGEDRTAPLLK